MKTGSHIYWLLWFGVGFGVPEIIGILHPQFDTLSSTFRWLRDVLPLWASVTVSGALGATLLWLLTSHWLFGFLDRDGFDLRENTFLLVGLGIGVASALLRPRKPKE